MFPYNIVKHRLHSVLVLINLWLMMSLQKTIPFISLTHWANDVVKKAVNSTTRTITSISPWAIFVLTLVRIDQEIRAECTKTCICGVCHAHFQWSHDHRCAKLFLNRRLAKSHLCTKSGENWSRNKSRMHKNQHFWCLRHPLPVITWPQVRTIFSEPASCL